MDMIHGRLLPAFLTVVALLCGVVLIGGCTASDSGGESNETGITGTGTVTYIDLEGGFYGIVADDGGQYLPLDLDEAFRQDGLEVRFTLEPADDMATIQQWGTPVRVVSIETI